VALEGIPLPLSCGQLIDSQALYDFNSNLSLGPSDGAQSSVHGQIDALGGKTCLITNLSTQEVFDLSVAELTPSSANQLPRVWSETGLADLPLVIPPNFQGVFRSDENGGLAQFVVGNYWIALSGITITSANEAKPIGYLVARTLN
jgi:hypothetical protein